MRAAVVSGLRRVIAGSLWSWGLGVARSRLAGLAVGIRLRTCRAPVHVILRDEGSQKRISSHYSVSPERWPFWHTVGLQAYSKDLRIRVIEAVDRGMPRVEVADQFMVSLRVLSAVEGSNAGSSGAGRPAIWPSRRDPGHRLVRSGRSGRGCWPSSKPIPRIPSKNTAPVGPRPTASRSRSRS
jgi:hypothetical protein